MEFKQISLAAAELKFDEARKGFFSGLASAFNGVDSYGDTIAPGAYKKTIKKRQRPIALRWNHYGPVIGKWTRIEETDAGLYVEGELTPGHSVADDVYASLKHGAVSGLSIGFRPVTLTDHGDGTRTLKEIELIEISIVESPADTGAQIVSVKALSQSKIDSAVMWLSRAIKLHEGHMDGSIETSDESQKKMMDQMRKALSFLSDEADVGMSPMKQIDRSESLKEIESLLRDAAGFSRADATALVSRIKSLSHGEREQIKTSEIIAAINAATHKLTTRK